MAATITISLEVELGWGFHDLSDPGAVRELSSDGTTEREAMTWLLDKCEQYDIPITFDIVGHLLLDSCSGNHPGPHPESWFDRDPGTDLSADPLFYAPKLAKSIRNSEVNHELATHTFSHVLCDEVRPEVVTWELNKVDQLHDDPVKSFVPPRHRSPPRSVLTDHNIKTLRKSSENEPPTHPVRRFFWMLTHEYEQSQLYTADGLRITSTDRLMTLSSNTLSRGVSPPHPAFQIIPEQIRSRCHRSRLLRSVETAIAEDGHLHLWSHLYNLANETQQGPIEVLFKRLSEYISKGLVVIKTMESLAKT
ncbi:Polysaccharide deacetylase [Halopenitus malekzadehii]|uniref:Polysaccharide deacetylase n=1 Tax=Halopenitus malekzadehii TaxID=1267564 RepID=A0A1H6IEK5_9EURY|nr:polysaccharide deacetylase family protein [Halopenitus malekzadehii]SEH46301.1 Polysaccharide deacetylase [Halopenitus malekzadehii]